jgi:hypothetical protein
MVLHPGYLDLNRGQRPPPVSGAAPPSPSELLLSLLSPDVPDVAGCWDHR